jgi:hypothetical protein
MRQLSEQEKLYDEQGSQTMVVHQAGVAVHCKGSRLRLYSKHAGDDVLRAGRLFTLLVEKCASRQRKLFSKLGHRGEKQLQQFEELLRC